MTASGPEADGEVRLLLRTVWDLLSEGEHWPTYTAVDRALHREHGIDADPVIARTPVAWLSGGRPEGGAGARPDASMSLTLDGALLCEASCAAIEVVARAAGLAAAAEASASGSEPAAVEFSDAGADVPDSQVRGVARASGLLLHAEPWTGHVLLWEGGWRMAADRRARRFAGVTGVDEFLAVRAAGEPALDAVTDGRWVVLGRRWRLGARLGRGGFGQVFRATGEDGTLAAVKLVPKEPGADRELLFADLGSARNVMPVLDSGETDDSIVIVMPLANGSLEDRLAQAGGPLPVGEAVAVLRDVAAALEDLAGAVVHRDIKPDNVLLLDGRWCLTDFGISRYAAASTSPDTHKWSLTPPYASPEQWRLERASSAADVYAVGVMAHRLLAGDLPFPGPGTEDFRDQHLHAAPAGLPSRVPARLAALVAECLSKPPQARPLPADVAARLARAAEPAASPGVAALADAYRDLAAASAARGAAESAARTEQQRRDDLFAAAARSHTRIGADLLGAVTDAAPTAAVNRRSDGGWTVSLGPARLGLSAAEPFDGTSWGGWQPPAFDVIAHSVVTVVTPPDRAGYEGRSHSLWFCDPTTPGAYGWHETAFMVSPLIVRRSRQDPFARPPGEESAKALSNAMTEYQAAWPFTPLVIGDLDEFVDRWTGWFAAAAQGALTRPSRMPEGQPEGTWRRQ